MRELIGQVAVRDDATATALRVISHFDDLVNAGASTATILRAAAALAGVAAGMHDGADGRTIRVDPPGSASNGVPAGDVKWPRATIEHTRASSVWIERSGDSGPLDSLILERCAQALRARRPSIASSLAKDELVRIACDEDASEDERRQACIALGLLAEPAVIVFPSRVISGLLSTTEFRGLQVLLAPSIELPMESSGMRSGSSVASDSAVPAALARAERALALSVHPLLGGPSHVEFENLGAAAVIAQHVSPASARASSDVAQLQRLRAGRPWLPALFGQGAVGQSIRNTAQSLHLHHSSLQGRSVWLENELGYSLRTVEGRHRAAATWLLWRISGWLHEP
jgi:hypothetical protein